jgi:polyhydroxyalkanoate synthase subunit PhaC
VRVVGWCLGGILSLLAHAYDRDLPIEAVALVASPWDFSKVPLVAPLRPIAAVTRGHGVTQLYRALGGAPAPFVKRGYQLAGTDKYVMKPWTVLSNLDDRDLLAQIEAVDAFMGRMHAYPGRTFGQLYHRLFRTNDLADGRLALTDTTIDLADVRAPLLAIAGRGDGIAPVPACHHLADLVPNAPIALDTAPGGHLGVLTGRQARGTTWRRLDEFLDASARRLATRAVA